MKTIKQGLLIFCTLTVIVGGIYPAFVYGISQIFFAEKARGGIVMYKDQKVGARLIAQEFTNDKYFWGRPSAAGYNASASGASNYALTNKDHQAAVKERKDKGLDYDLLTTSGSGLDPHISPDAAYLQVERVAKSRGLNPEVVTKLVKENIEGRQLGFLGEERVNVLRLNLSLETLVHE
ncbi:potassium-transporting ATPase subunit KdpC [Bacteriovorax sp. PP10]|uniref:Potassium-transporting ATPase KdpC subunit n=1 Tax=Bacteriovorax antarcticus TaxID=3088717 RepID=A0ABU5VVS9_9BACT|nr:potassium-transporting ATPase subunit KdpC [Bacteriovorax sp. PP10]MEA9357168.1 potassium-transporting ATPase subunit KdpC [Bacteriovorax sp. PP10]